MNKKRVFSGHKSAVSHTSLQGFSACIVKFQDRTNFNIQNRSGYKFLLFNPSAEELLAIDRVWETVKFL